MMNVKRSFTLLLPLLLLGGCVTMPTGPSVLVLPAPGKPFDLFQAEDASCRQWARMQIGMSPQDTANQNAVASGVVGAVVGTAIGAAMGSASGRGGEGAIIGGGTGLLFGAAQGSESGRLYGWEAQHRYDITYQQCMYAKGNVLPGMTRPVWRTMPRGTYPPPPPPGPGDAYPGAPPYPPPGQ
jgi:hypothetical protein